MARPKKTASKQPAPELETEECPKTFTPEGDWIKNRLRERGVTIERAASALGTYKAMLHRIVSGARPARPDEIIKMADLLGITTIEALRRFGYAVPELRIDLIGRVNADGRVIFFAPDQVRKVDSPADAAADTRALIVDAPHSRLAIYDGAVMYYAPSPVVDAQATGRLSIIEISEQAAPVLGILNHLAAGRKRVTIIGGIETLETKSILTAAPVTWIRNL